MSMANKTDLALEKPKIICGGAKTSRVPPPPLSSDLGPLIIYGSPDRKEQAENV